MAETIHRHGDPQGAPRPASRYSQLVSVEPHRRWVWFSGQVGVAPDGTLAEDAAGQIRQAWANLLALLHAEGLGPENLVRTNAYLTRQDLLPAYRAARDAALAGAAPASTLLVVAGLADPAWVVEIEAVAAS
ncbi:Enamine deaminase RidA, house cleaning of reactive enamine intermediates, YjgF/YER057c/UK114 family [Tistlia consotensis]|uniref:Enamine deaminase RidA, house cleaning of reactive enamine intermediates, YjgF/YER057c/UK114 family n=1 Tax=Tistlia consotensis USBA 355 TaxID=560819 RepID=A0A1Y6BBQ5_9PROT|nr:RidA family protein [Tistlia consotensis]SME94761.1 Enamine deaminase RidA, house cleaning of reactive enamine intermediates, YjgF/YER057c/UK114 family [Tistlia consotensis USBA 355]SNR29542.1 Enamine deaminase RidA, house cleaning of reactive enamine intermediates, YjgF/YER057c/UK114 family [Tistlia consotensis]